MRVQSLGIDPVFISPEGQSYTWNKCFYFEIPRYGFLLFFILVGSGLLCSHLNPTVKLLAGLICLQIIILKFLMTSTRKTLMLLHFISKPQQCASLRRGPSLVLKEVWIHLRLIYIRKIHPLSLSVLYIKAHFSLKFVLIIISGSKWNDLIYEINEPLARHSPHTVQV